VPVDLLDILLRAERCRRLHRERPPRGARGLPARADGRTWPWWMKRSCGGTSGSSALASSRSRDKSHSETWSSSPATAVACPAPSADTAGRRRRRRARPPCLPGRSHPSDATQWK
jgi:hypothetical protein